MSESRPSRYIAILDADAKTARVLGRGECACCAPAVRVELIASDLHPAGRWLDDGGAPQQRALEGGIAVFAKRTLSGRGRG